MPTLQNLDGSPLSWAELYKHLDAYWAWREEQEHPQHERRSGYCVRNDHLTCSGRMVRDVGVPAHPQNLIACPCECHQ